MRIKLSATECAPISPCFSLSSGMCATPNSLICLGENSLIEVSPIKISPVSIVLNPVMVSTSSLCPFPSTPAMPKISPDLTSRDRSFTARSLLSSSTQRFFTLSTVSSGDAASLDTRRTTLRPTIISARPDSSVSAGVVEPTT